MRKIMLLMIICVFTIGTRGEGIRFFKGSFQDALKPGEGREQESVCRFLYHLVRTLSADVQEYIPG